jgi:hypothetical protein
MRRPADEESPAAIAGGTAPMSAAAATMRTVGRTTPNATEAKSIDARPPSACHRARRLNKTGYRIPSAVLIQTVPFGGGRVGPR